MGFTTVHLISLGCPKNRVDSEIMLGRLLGNGVQLTPDPEAAQVIVVNTCSFIKSAIDESIDVILEAARYKETGQCRRLVVTGCLPERFRQTLADQLPEVDVFLGTGAYEEILSALGEEDTPSRCRLPSPEARPLMDQRDHRTRTAPHLAYVKIAEGCDRGCTYCIIPKLRGRQKSRPAASIVSEAEFLVATGVKELVLVAQETTAYGTDLSPETSIAALLEQISRIPGDFWIRVLYGHPASIGESFLESVVRHAKVCPYFDVPVQHGSDALLKKMGRAYSRQMLYALFENIRSTVPEAALRTTFLVGFPGETDRDFERLCRLAEDIRFDHAGVFLYSDAEDLPAHRLGPRVPRWKAEKRRQALMERQAGIAFEKNRLHLNRVYPVLLEEKAKKDLFLGRAPFQAPEVDGITRVTGRNLEPGTFVRVRITGANTYDLMGEAL